MAASSLRQHQVGRYLLGWGVQQCLIDHGQLVTVRSFTDQGAMVVNEGGRLIQLHFDVALPSPRAMSKLQCWMKMLRRSCERSAPIRMLGLQSRPDGSMAATEQSIFILQNQMVDRHDWRLFEIFAGGYGGWGRSSRWLQEKQNFVNINLIGGMEVQPECSEYWGKNQQRHGEVLTCDATRFSSWEAMNEKEPNLLSISSPCQSFSFAGSQAGWNSYLSATLAIALWYSYLSGYQVVMVENVHGLKGDRQNWHFFQELCAFCGYEIIFQTSMDMTSCHPVERQRLLVILQAKEDAKGFIDVSHAWLNEIYGSTTLWGTNRWFTLPNEFEQLMALSDDLIPKYADLQRLPANMRMPYQMMNPQEVLYARMAKSNQPLKSGTIMAQYGNQHNLRGAILGSLRKTATGYRFFHPLELVASMGTTSEVHLPSDSKIANMIAGNAISEFHALVVLLSLLHGVVPETNPANLLKQHASECLHSKNCAFTMLGADVVLTYGTTPARIITIGNSAIDPPFYCKIEKGTRSRSLVEAEMKLHPHKRGVGLFDSDDQIMEDEELIDSFSLALVHSDVVPLQFPFGVVLNWSGGSVRVDVPHTATISECMINGCPAKDMTWITSDSKVLPHDAMLGWGRTLTTHEDWGWPPEKIQGEIMIVRVLYGEITQQWLSHDANESLDDLLHAEQALAGAGCRVVEACDRNGSLMPQSTKLRNVEMVVVRFQQPHTYVQITMQVENEVTTNFWPQGTRVFQMCDRLPGQIPVNDNGQELPWDVPIFRPMSIRIIYPDDEESDRDDTSVVTLTPTVPFTIQEDQPPLENAASQNLSIAEIIRGATDNVTTAMLRASHMSEGDGHFRRSQRLNLLCMRGLAMGDDEMSGHLRSIQTRTEANVIGIASWNEQCCHWRIHHEWFAEWIIDHEKTNVGVIHFQSHWAPFRFRPYSGTLEIWNDYDLGPQQGQELLRDLRLVDGNLEVYPMQSLPECCGFQSILMLETKLNIQPSEEENAADADLLNAWVSDSTNAQYQAAVQRCDNPVISMAVKRMRRQFIANVLQIPSMPKYHGMGKEESHHQKLRLSGQISSVLIARGHPGPEALQVGQELSKQEGLQLRDLTNHKEQKAYGLIIEACERFGIAIQCSKQSQAIRKLQTFFRAKHHQQKMATQKQYDIKQLTFVPKSWMIQNGQFVDPQLNFSASSRGLSLAYIDEISDLAKKGKLLTQESNSVLTMEKPQCVDDVKTEQVIASVEDASSNRALMKFWMTHFGLRPVIRAPLKSGNVDIEGTHTLALHVHREFVGEPFWAKMIESPAKVVLAAMRDDTMEAARVFSRRWTLKSRPADPALADAFSVLVIVENSQLDKWLSKSGMTQPPIFTQIKKQEDGSDASAKYRIIWLGRQLTDALSQTSSLKHHAGMILKPPMSFGARIHVDHFDEGWKALKGNDPVPVTLEVKYKYQLSNLPDNIKAQDIENWSKQMGWECRVLRRFNNGSFLVGASTSIPSLHLSLNGCSILVSDFIEAKKTSGCVIAGKLQASAPKMYDTVQDLTEDPWHGQSLSMPHQPKPTMISNPGAWSRYQPTNGSNATSASQSGNESRFVAIETEVQQLKEQLKSNHAESQSRIHQLDTRMGTIQHDLQQSLREALKEQSASLISTFEALIKTPQAPTEQREPRERSRSKGRGS